MPNTITLGISTSNVNRFQKGVSSFTKSFRYVRKCKRSQTQKPLKWAIPRGSPEPTFEMKTIIVSIDVGIDQRCQVDKITLMKTWSIQISSAILLGLQLPYNINSPLLGEVVLFANILTKESRFNYDLSVEVSCLHTVCWNTFQTWSQILPLKSAMFLRRHYMSCFPSLGDCIIYENLCIIKYVRDELHAPTLT